MHSMFNFSQNITILFLSFTGATKVLKERILLYDLMLQ